MSVGRICTRNVVLATASETVKTIAERMLQFRVGTVVVLNDQRRLCGLLTDRDIVTRVVAAGKDPHKTLVRDVMTTDPMTISENSPVEAAIGLMRSGSFRRLPVVGEREELVGLVSLDDVLSLLAEELAKVGALLDSGSRVDR